MKKALEPLILSWRVPELRQRILFVLGAMVVYVLAVYVPVPRVQPRQVTRTVRLISRHLDFIDIFGGGALSRLSVVALGIMPLHYRKHRVSDLDDCFSVLQRVAKRRRVRSPQNGAMDTLGRNWSDLNSGHHRHQSVPEPGVRRLAAGTGVFCRP
jgi:hypothetical protein